MLTSIVALVGGLVMGVLWGRPSDNRKQCGARMAKTTIKNPGYGHEKRIVEEGVIRCKEMVDPRCLGGNCALHCRDAKRCNGKCLNEAG